MPLLEGMTNEQAADLIEQVRTGRVSLNIDMVNWMTALHMAEQALRAQPQRNVPAKVQQCEDCAKKLTGKFYAVCPHCGGRNLRLVPDEE